MLYVEHKHSPRPFTLLSVFLATEVASAAATWLHNVALVSSLHSALCTLATTLTLTAKLYSLILHETSNWDNLTEAASRTVDRQETHGFWSRCFSVSLLGDLTWISQDQPAVININTKGPQRIESLRLRRFGTAWTNHEASSLRLLQACASSVKQNCIYAILSVLCTIPFKLVAPFYVEELVRRAEHRTTAPRTGSIDGNTDTHFILHMSVIVLGYLVSRACSRYAVSILKLGIRATLSEAVFSKLPKIAGAAAAQHTKLSIIADDIPAMEESAELLLRSCANFLDALFAIYFVRRQSNVIASLLILHVASKLQLVI